MAEPKTKKTDADVGAFLDSLADPKKAADARRLRSMMEAATGEPAFLYGANIVGVGGYRYRYASGEEGTWFLCGFSPRKANLVLYVMPGFAAYDGLLARLGPHKTGRSCLYLKRLSDVDVDVLEELIVASVAAMREKHPPA